MAKALLGYLGGTETALIDQNRILKRRVTALEAENTALKAENDRLAAAAAAAALTTIDPMDSPEVLLGVDEFDHATV